MDAETVDAETVDAKRLARVGGRDLWGSTGIFGDVVEEGVYHTINRFLYQHVV